MPRFYTEGLVWSARPDSRGRSYSQDLPKCSVCFSHFEFGLKKKNKCRRNGVNEFYDVFVF